MASYPTSKVHRVNRRKLGKGQRAHTPPGIATVTNTVAVVHLAFNVPVVISGPVPITVATLTYLSQNVVDNQHVDVTFNATTVSHAWALTGGGSTIQTYQGGTVASASGTF